MNRTIDGKKKKKKASNIDIINPGFDPLQSVYMAVALCPPTLVLVSRSIAYIVHGRGSPALVCIHVSVHCIHCTWPWFSRSCLYTCLGPLHTLYMAVVLPLLSVYMSRSIAYIVHGRGSPALVCIHVSVHCIHCTWPWFSRSCLYTCLGPLHTLYMAVVLPLLSVYMSRSIAYIVHGRGSPALVCIHVSVHYTHCTWPWFSRSFLYKSLSPLHTLYMAVVFQLLSVYMSRSIAHIAHGRGSPALVCIHVSVHCRWSVELHVHALV